MGFYFCSMSKLLLIETSSKNCSVGVSCDGVLQALNESNEASFSHAEKLHIFIKETLRKAELKKEDLEAIVVGMGPGSYTGLRIGVAAAKGLCYALDAPLIAISSLETIAYATKDIVSGDTYIIPQIDARRMEVYTAVFDQQGKTVQTPWAAVLDIDSYSTYLDEKICWFVGDGQEKWKNLSQHKNAMFLENITVPSVQNMVSLCTFKFHQQAFEDVAYFEPFYLKEFYTTPPKKS